MCARALLPPARGHIRIDNRSANRESIVSREEDTHVSKGMQFAVFGVSLVSGYRNGGATYCRGLLRALARRGHAIRFYEPVSEDRLMHRDIVDPGWAEVVRFTADGEGVEAALEDAADADVLMKCSGIGVFDDLLDGALPHCAVPPAISVYWDLNPAVTLARLATEAGHTLRAELPWYDLVLTRYGGIGTVEAFQRYGTRTCFPIYNALDPDVHFPVAPDRRAACALVLLAHRTEEREAQVRQNLFDVAATYPQERFILGGCDWEDVAMPTNVHYAGYVYTAEHNLYYSAATAVLNVTSPSVAALECAPSARLFEAAGAGACIIGDAWAGLETFLEPEREILIARDTLEVIEQLNGLNPERAAAIGRRANERIRLEHTYDRRAAELDALLEGFDRQWVDRTAL